YNRCTVTKYENYCNGLCRWKDCTVEYFENVKRSWYNTTKDYIIQFHAASSHFVNFIHRPLQTECQYLADIGGIFGVWLGVCVLDVYYLCVKVHKSLHQVMYL